MKRKLLYFLFLLIPILAFAQPVQKPKRVFELAYDTADLLSIIPYVDTLNQQFLKRHSTGSYKSVQQTTGTYISIDFTECEDPAADLLLNMPLKLFLKKYPQAEIKRDILITREAEDSYCDERQIRYTYMNPNNNNYNYHIDVNDSDISNLKYKGKVVFQKYKYAQNIEAFYFYEDFKATPIPYQYANYIDYSNTIFDSSVKVYNGYPLNYFFGSKPADYRAYLISDHFLADSFIRTISLKYDLLNYPFYMAGYTIEADFSKKFIPANKLAQIKGDLTASKELNTFFHKAIDSALTNHHSNSAFEYIVGQLVSLQKELQIRQGREPRRTCGNDDAPKIQDYSIATLALQLHNLKLFLQAHRYVMTSRIEGHANDKKFGYERLSYLDELEFIHINLEEYFIGSFLSSENDNNAYQNEYYKYAELFDFNNRQAVEARILEAIGDNRLDDFNRIYFAKLFAEYCINETNFEKKKYNIGRLKEAVKAFPAYIKFDYAAYEKSKVDD
jgi:hypothetical protein